MKKIILLISLVFGYSHTAFGYGLPKQVFFTPDIETENILYQYTTPQPSICFHPDDVTVRILMYHYVREEHRDPVGSTTANNSITAHTFENHVRALSNAQNQGSVRLFFLSELQHALNTGCFPHDRLIILTADDGWRDNYGQMFPLLKQYQTKMNLGIVTDVIGEGDERTDPFMNKNELTEMVQSPFVEVQSHTRTHRDLRNLSYASLKYELCESKRTLEERFGKEISTITYPVGKYNASVLAVAKECGYTLGLTTQYGESSPQEITQNPLAIQRIRITKQTPITTLLGQ